MAATINEQTSGGKTVYRLRFKVDGKVHRVSLGNKLPQKVKRPLLNLVDNLLAHKSTGEPLSAELIKGISALGSQLRDRLSDTGLFAVKSTPKLKEFLDAYIQQKNDVTDHTRYKLRNSARLFCEYFGNVKLTAISAGDVEDYIESRKSAAKAEATIGAEIKHGKQFFAYAVKKQYISENPFSDFKVGSQVDKKRNQILNASMLEKVIESLPTLEWRAFISILRWTGCRQSEALLLKWIDILWDEKRIRMPSPKTAKQGKSTRIVPLFPELLPVLREWFEQSPDGAEYVISGLVSGINRTGRQGRNLGQPFTRLITLAGYAPWAKPFQNLRSTRENELERTHKSHVVQEWIGHSRKTAEKHYLRVSDDDFKKATEWSDSGQQRQADQRRGYKQEQSAKRKPAFQLLAELCKDSESGQTPRGVRRSNTGVCRARCLAA